MHLLYCQPQTVYKKGTIEIDYFEKFSCLQLSWSGPISQETYYAVLEVLLNLTHRFQAQFWIFDAREEDYFKLYDPEWATKFYTQLVPDSCIKKIARLASGNSKNEIKLSNFITKILEDNALTIKFKYMPDTNHALEWFLEADN